MTNTVSSNCVPARPAVMTKRELLRDARPAASAKGTVKPSARLIQFTELSSKQKDVSEEMGR